MTGKRTTSASVIEDPEIGVSETGGPVIEGHAIEGLVIEGLAVAVREVLDSVVRVAHRRRC